MSLALVQATPLKTNERTQASRSYVFNLQPHFAVQVCRAVMEGFTFFLRLGGKVVGRISAHLDTSNTLACAKGSLAWQSVCSPEWSRDLVQ